MTMGMPSALNFRGGSNIREWQPQQYQSMTNYLYSVDSGNPCAFNYYDDVERNYVGRDCKNIWPSNSYLGYSTVFITNITGNTHLVASSAPRETLNGTVRLFRLKDSSSGGKNMFEMSPLIVGPTKGSYFGHSIAAVDIDGDRRKDLIVGAPYYTAEKHEINKGAIYIYQQIDSYVRFFVKNIIFFYENFQ